MLSLLTALATEYASNREVSAVALGGSRSTGADDEWSDFDLYVYTQSQCDLETRKQVAQRHGVRFDIDNRFWEPGDEWIDESGRHVDVMFRQVAWIEEQLTRVLEHYQAAVGYSTCFWANVLYARPLFDREGWFARLQERARVPYPEGLRAAIIAKNWPILRNTLSSYRHQLARAIDRDDPVSIQHRVTAALASYFDIVFAINRMPHPGEKRLLAIVERRCELRPAGYAGDVRTLLRLAAGGAVSTLSAYDAVMDGLDDLLRASGWPDPILKVAGVSSGPVLSGEIDATCMAVDRLFVDTAPSGCCRYGQLMPEWGSPASGEEYARRSILRGESSTECRPSSILGP